MSRTSARSPPGSAPTSRSSGSARAPTTPSGSSSGSSERPPARSSPSSTRPTPPSSRRPPSGASSPTSPTPTPTTGRARSTSCCAASPNTTNLKARSGAGAEDEHGLVAEAGQLGGPVELGRHLVDVADELAGLRRRVAVLAIEEHVQQPGSRQRGHEREQRVHVGERVVLVGVHGVQQDDATDLRRVV